MSNPGEVPTVGPATAVLKRRLHGRAASANGASLSTQLVARFHDAVPPPLLQIAVRRLRPNQFKLLPRFVEVPPAVIPPPTTPVASLSDTRTFDTAIVPSA